MPNRRADHVGENRTAFDKNRRRVLMTEDVCAICGKPVDKTLKPPHPLAPVVDHIIPINRGGHPSDINNLQLAHATCNRMKSDKLTKELCENGNATSGVLGDKNVVLSNRNLPLSVDWKSF